MLNLFLHEIIYFPLCYWKKVLFVTQSFMLEETGCKDLGLVVTFLTAYFKQLNGHRNYRYRAGTFLIPTEYQDISRTEKASSCLFVQVISIKSELFTDVQKMNLMPEV